MEERERALKEMRETKNIHIVYTPHEKKHALLQRRTNRYITFVFWVHTREKAVLARTFAEASIDLCLCVNLKQDAC